jgi:hypothetical protein
MAFGWVSFFKVFTLKFVFFKLPLAKAIDPKNGAKINRSMQMIAMFLQMISKINIAMKNSLIEEGKVEVAEQVKNS